MAYFKRVVMISMWLCHSLVGLEAMSIFFKKKSLTIFLGDCYVTHSEASTEHQNYLKEYLLHLSDAIPFVTRLNSRQVIGS